MLEKIDSIIKKIDEIEKKSVNYKNKIIQKEYEVEALLYEKNKLIKEESLFNILTQKGIYIFNIDNNSSSSLKKIFGKIVVFYVENRKYIKSITFNQEVLKNNIEIELNVKTYEEILLISENLVRRFDYFIKNKNIVILINNLDDDEVIRNLKNEFKNRNNESNIVKNVFSDQYQINIISSVDDELEKGIDNISSCSVYITPLKSINHKG